jgi:hypothetical protein
VKGVAAICPQIVKALRMPAVSRAASGFGLALAAAAVDGACPDRFVHDPADRPGAPAAFGTATKTPVDFAGAARRTFGRYRPHLMVGYDVARTHDHGARSLLESAIGVFIGGQSVDRHFLAMSEIAFASAMIRNRSKLRTVAILIC